MFYGIWLDMSIVMGGKCHYIGGNIFYQGLLPSVIGVPHQLIHLAKMDLEMPKVKPPHHLPPPKPSFQALLVVAMKWCKFWMKSRSLECEIRVQHLQIHTRYFGCQKTLKRKVTLFGFFFANHNDYSLHVTFMCSFSVYYLMFVIY